MEKVGAGSQKVRKVVATTTKSIRSRAAAERLSERSVHLKMKSDQIRAFLNHFLFWNTSESSIFHTVCSVCNKSVYSDTNEVTLTSMGLFFLPTLLVCSFSGCGRALLTGGLKHTAGLQTLLITTLITTVMHVSYEG